MYKIKNTFKTFMVHGIIPVPKTITTIIWSKLSGRCKSFSHSTFEQWKNWGNKQLLLDDLKDFIGKYSGMYKNCESSLVFLLLLL